MNLTTKTQPNTIWLASRYRICRMMRFTCCLILIWLWLMPFVHAQEVAWLENVAQPNNLYSMIDESNGDSSIGYAGCRNTASADGRYVVFESMASNLVAGDTNLQKDVFLKDLGEGLITRISVNHLGAQLEGASHTACISKDGNKITFISASQATDEVDHRGDDLYLYDRTDRTNPTLTLISKPNAALGSACIGDVCEGYAANAAVSGDGRFVVFAAVSDHLVSGITHPNWRQIYLYDVVSRTIVLVSRNTSGAEPNSIADAPSISNDGSKIVFSSKASDLITSDLNGRNDVFVFDTGTESMTRLSQTSSGTGSNQNAIYPVISGNGEKVLFYSSASNLLARDHAGANLYYADVNTGNLQLVNTPSGSDTNNRNLLLQGYWGLSDDGVYVVFSSGDNSLVGSSLNLPDSVFLKNMTTGAVNRVAPESIDLGKHISASAPRISPENERIYFVGHANDQVETDSNNVADVFVHTLATANTSLLSVPNKEVLTVSGANGVTGVQRVGYQDILSGGRKISTDGRYVVFASNANNLVEGALVFQGSQNIYLYDRGKRQMHLVSKSIRSTPNHRDAYAPSISADGKYVVFHSSRDDLIDGVPAPVASGSPHSQVFLYDVFRDELSLVSVGADGTSPANNRSTQAAISANGEYVVFISSASNLIAEGVGALDQVYGRNLTTGQTLLISQQKVPATAVVTPSDGRCDKPSVSAGGLAVVFDCEAGNLVVDDTNGVKDVFLWSGDDFSIKRISTHSDGTQSNGVSEDGVVSDDGQWVAFTSSASNLVTPETTARRKVYRYRISTEQTELASISTSGITPVASTGAPSISADGRYIAFGSDDALLVGAVVDDNFKQDAFVRDMKAGATKRVSVDSRRMQGNEASSSPSISADGRFVYFASESRNWQLDSGAYAMTESGQPFLVELSGFVESSTLSFQTNPMVVSDFRTPLTVEVTVEGQTTQPVDGNVVVRAETGESCIANVGTTVSGTNRVIFRCTLHFLNSQPISITAGFSASATHHSSSGGAAVRTNQIPQALAQDVVAVHDGFKDITLTGTDADGDVLTYRLVDMPRHGTLSGSVPFVTYQPEAGYEGSDSFSFVVNDGYVDSEHATIRITVPQPNQPPVGIEQNLNVGENESINITLSGTDANGDVLSYRILSAPKHGSLTGTAPNLTYTPNDGYTGSDGFVFVVNDGRVDSVPAIVNVMVGSLSNNIFTNGFED